MADADISSIDYDAVAEGAVKLSNYADSMQESIKSAFSEITNMSESWKGGSYDSVVKAINKAVNRLNTLFEKTVYTLPSQIYQKALSTAAGDSSDLTISSSFASPITLTELSTTDVRKLTFKSSSVADYQSKIKSDFTQAHDYAENARELASDLKDEWDSTAGRTNLSEIRTAFKQVQEKLNSFQSLIDNAISTQSAVAAAIETANSTLGAIQDVAEYAVEDAEDAITTATNTINEALSDLFNV